jgi:hypothetical protein
MEAPWHSPDAAAIGLDHQGGRAMVRRDAIARTLVALLVLLPVSARAGIDEIAKCQKRMAAQGARYAQRVINSNLRCTNAVTECQVECEQGVFGPPCDPTPQPGCCDPDDPPGNVSYNACLQAAQQLCDQETAKRANWETVKVNNITVACSAVTLDELCGATTPGLNFDTLNAGCLALDPNYTCTLANLVNCVGGPLVHDLLDQITSTLSPRASDAVAALGLQAAFPDLPVSRKVKDTVAGGHADVWQISGQAGDEIVVRVRTKDDLGTSTSTLAPHLFLLGSDLAMPIPVANTTIRSIPCSTPNACGNSCPLFKRVLPFDGTFNLAVTATPLPGCPGGRYTLVVTSPSGVVPTLAADDIVIPSLP